VDHISYDPYNIIYMHHTREVWSDGSKSHRMRLTWSHMHKKSRWLNFKMAQTLDHVSFYRDGSLFWTISVLMIVKVSHLSKKTHWTIMISHSYHMQRSLMHIIGRIWDISHSMTFWAISQYARCPYETYHMVHHM